MSRHAKKTGLKQQSTVESESAEESELRRGDLQKVSAPEELPDGERTAP